MGKDESAKCVQREVCTSVGRTGYNLTREPLGGGVALHSGARAGRCSPATLDSVKPVKPSLTDALGLGQAGGLASNFRSHEATYFQKRW